MPLQASSGRKPPLKPVKTYAKTSTKPTEGPTKVPRPYRPPYRKRRKRPQNGMQNQDRDSVAEAVPPAGGKPETPPAKRLQPLKTLSELRSSSETIEALVVEIPAKLANTALSILRPVLPTSPLNRSFGHLRRFTVWKYIPDHIKAAYGNGDNAATAGVVFLLLPPPFPLQPEEIIPTALESHCDGRKPRLFHTLVPTETPANQAQAKEWSVKHWPTVYNPASQPLTNAPPLATLRSTITELETDDARHIDTYMGLAKTIADESYRTGLGKWVGAVIVDPSKNSVVAVGGDRRWLKDGMFNGSVLPAMGRPEHHALMRAIEFVAMAERNRRSMKASNASITKEILGSLTASEVKHSMPPNPAQATDEETLVDQMGALQVSSTPRAGGYLCTGLDLYITHEPCVCCSMAMLHSRFRTCVFETRMPGSGGLSGEQDNGGLGYGMFWRRELNWRTLAFQMKPLEATSATERLMEAKEEKRVYHA